MASQLVGGYRFGGYQALARFAAEWNSVRAKSACKFNKLIHIAVIRCGDCTIRGNPLPP
jgi:hypothetical protein